MGRESEGEVLVEFPKIICVCVYSTLVCGSVVVVAIVPPVHGNK